MSDFEGVALREWDFDTLVPAEPLDTPQTILVGAAAVVSGSAGHTIQDEGVDLTARTNLNFVGSTVAVTDSVGESNVPSAALIARELAQAAAPRV